MLGSQPDWGIWPSAIAIPGVRFIDGPMWVNGPWCGNVGKLQFPFKTSIEGVLVFNGCVTNDQKLDASSNTNSLSYSLCRSEVQALPL